MVENGAGSEEALRLLCYTEKLNNSILQQLIQILCRVLNSSYF